MSSQREKLKKAKKRWDRLVVKGSADLRKEREREGSAQFEGVNKNGDREKEGRASERG